MKKVVSIIILVLITVFVGILVFVNTGYSLELNGNSSIEIEVNNNYEDLGVVAKHFDEDISDNIKVKNNVDISKVGEYEVVYTLDKFLVVKHETRKVIVKDKTAPTIVLNGNSKIILKVGNKYTESGVSATDNYDGDITDKVIVEGSVDTSKTGEYTLTYKIKDSSGNEASVKRYVVVEEGYTGGYGVIIEGPTYINGILIVNKKYSIPKDFGGVDPTAKAALEKLQAGAKKEGVNLSLVSAYRSYETQKRIYNNYISKYGQKYADSTSARPGHSEHQTGLAFDIGNLNTKFGNTTGGIWLRENCHKYGFILRYLKGKEDITGYSYEPWHIRYVGVEIATEIMSKNITLEEYLGV